MADVIIMPKLGQATEESTIVKWHKREGDAVKKGDILFEMETDKAVLEAESFFEGTLLKVLVPEGVTIPVNAPVGYIGKPGEKLPDAPPAAPKAPEVRDQRSEVKDQKSDTGQTKATTDQGQRTTDVAQIAKPAPVAAPRPIPAAPSRLFISPRAKALAEAKVISPASIRGSGPNGRITVKDVEAYLEANHYGDLKISPAAKNMAAKEKLDVLKIRGTGTGGRIMTSDVERAVKEKPKTMSKMRQVIARRLTESFTTTPHFYVTVSIDMTDLFVYRKELKDRGEVYTVTDFILEAVVLSLLELPGVNSVTDGTTVTWRGSVNLGMAVSVAEGLVVPAIRNAESLSMKELHDTAKALAEKARAGKLLPDEMTGSTFTVSNMGMLNVENFHAIINPGEGAILAVASTIDTPVVKDGQIKVRSMMKVTLSTDHRIVDGATGAAFVNAIKSKLEDVELWKSLT